MERINYVLTLTEEEWNTIHTALMKEFAAVNSQEALELLRNTLRATYQFKVVLTR